MLSAHFMQMLYNVANCLHPCSACYFLEIQNNVLIHFRSGQVYEMFCRDSSINIKTLAALLQLCFFMTSVEVLQCVQFNLLPHLNRCCAYLFGQRGHRVSDEKCLLLSDPYHRICYTHHQIFCFKKYVCFVSHTERGNVL